MRVDIIGTLPVDPAWIEKTKAGSAATAQASPSKNPKETQDPRRFLQKDPRSADEIKQDIEKMNDQLRYMNRSIRFRIDDNTRDIVAKVVDENTGEVIMEIPPEEILKLRERLSEMSGLLMEKQV